MKQVKSQQIKVISDSRFKKILLFFLTHESIIRKKKIQNCQNSTQRKSALLAKPGRKQHRNCFFLTRIILVNFDSNFSKIQFPQDF